MLKQLHSNWANNLATLVSEASEEVFISSPFVTQNGVEFVLKNLSNKFKEKGKFTFLTNLSPVNIIQGSNDPSNFKSLSNELNDFSIWHLPKLHAKVYISDKVKSIITSGNLTNGGLYANFEYGIQIENEIETQKIHTDINQYCQLGSLIDIRTLDNLIVVSEKITRNIIERKNAISLEIDELLQSVKSELVKDRLNVGPIHNVFSKTILYLLKRNPFGLKTTEIHNKIQEIHPDLCDEDDRIIDGKHFGKKWKHAVRTSQQHLKKNGLIKLENGLWKIIRI